MAWRAPNTIYIHGLDTPLTVRHGSISSQSENWRKQPVLLLQDDCFQLTNSLKWRNKGPLAAHFILFTTDGHTGQPYGNRGSLEQFHILDEGNLRSAMGISELISDFHLHRCQRKHITQRRNLRQHPPEDEQDLLFDSAFPISPGIRLETSPPQIAVFETVSNFISDLVSDSDRCEREEHQRREEFMDFCRDEIGEILIRVKSMPTLIYAVRYSGEPSIDLKFDPSSASFNSVNTYICNSAEEFSGNQYPRVILILTHQVLRTDIPEDRRYLNEPEDRRYLNDLEMAMSRATAFLHVLCEYRADVKEAWVHQFFRECAAGRFKAQGSIKYSRHLRAESEIDFNQWTHV